MATASSSAGQSKSFVDYSTNPTFDTIFTTLDKAYTAHQKTMGQCVKDIGSNTLAIKNTYAKINPNSDLKQLNAETQKYAGVYKRIQDEIQATADLKKELAQGIAYLAQVKALDPKAVAVLGKSASDAIPLALKILGLLDTYHADVEISHKSMTNEMPRYQRNFQKLVDAVSAREGKGVGYAEWAGRLPHWINFLL